METIQAIYEFLQKRTWLQVDDPEEQIAFLAAGEYNENYLISVEEIYGTARHVFRINHGSQLGLANQVEYEFAVLLALARSGVTPRPYYCEPEPGFDELGKGVLLMEYLPGRPLDYARDWREAASIFASVHAQPADNRLISQSDPVKDIARECEGLIRRYPDHPMIEARDRLLRYHEQVLEMADEFQALTADDAPVMANTEVNSHNFLVDDETGRGWLVDWEKCVVTSRFQDIGHFLVPTTTLWKTDFEFSLEGKRDFVAAYLDLCKAKTGAAMDLETALRCTEIMERTILLRAMSWCYMAHYEYTQGGRALKNADTFARIEHYLDRMAWFFESKT